MNLSHSATTQRPGQWLLASLASTALLLSGCSNLISTAPSSGPVSAAAILGGHVHGGNQPVAFATVNLYFAGQNGIGSAAQLAATTKTADDGGGSFSFTKLADGGTNDGTTNSFSCPTPAMEGSPYVYVVATGGNTLNTHDSTVNNKASVFIAPLGLCSGLTPATFVYMSEAVTAATVAAVHQYMNVATGSIGADGILASYDGLANSFNVVSSMVSLSTGQTLASTTQTGSPASVTVTAMPEQAKLNQVANMLAACVNNASSTATACTTLFANAVPPASASTTSRPTDTFSAPTDVVQAAYYIFTNPTNSNTTNLTNLYNLAGGAGAPYQPTLAAIPSDWSIGIQYVATGDCGTAGSGFISNPYDINIDLIGNLWISNQGGLSEMSSTGTPLSCHPIAGTSYGGTIDSTGKIWAGDATNHVVYRYDPDPTNKTPLLAFPTLTAPFALAADGNGNIFYSDLPASSSIQGAVWKIAGGATATAAVAPLQIAAAVGATPARVVIDYNGAIWASSRDAFVSLITPATTGTTLLNGYVTTQIPTNGPSYGLSATPSLSVSNVSGVYVSSQEGSNKIDLVTGTGTTYAEASGFPTAANAGGLNTPSAIAIDGAQNVWAANDGTDSGSGLSLVSELTRSGTSLSPDGTVNGGYQKALNYFVNGRTITVDQSGNVWVGRDGSGSITEIVGGGVPIFQPFAVGLQKGRFQVIP